MGLKRLECFEGQLEPNFLPLNDIFLFLQDLDRVFQELLHGLVQGCDSELGLLQGLDLLLRLKGLNLLFR